MYNKIIKALTGYQNAIWKNDPIIVALWTESVTMRYLPRRYIEEKQIFIDIIDRSLLVGSHS